MTKKLAQKAKSKAPAKKPVAATKIVKKAKVAKPTLAVTPSAKKSSKSIVKTVKALLKGKVAPKIPVKAKPAPKPIVKKTAAKPVKAVKPAKPASVKAAKSAPKVPVKSQTVAKPAAKVPASTPVLKKNPAAAPVVAPAARAPAPKAMASSAKPTAAVKVKRPPPANGVEFAGNLADEDIRAMPEDEYMNDVQLEFFRQRLIKMREEVLARELDVKERLHQREVFADPADRATAEEEHWLDLRLRERESMLMRKIEDSLRRIRDREYGYCTKTGEAIGIPRLLARPTATVIVDVKGQDEKVETHFRDR